MVNCATSVCNVAQNAVRIVLGKELKLYIVAADHSEPARNASVKLGVPVFQHCFPHVIRKPADTRKRHLFRGTKEQRDCFIEVVKEDIRHLHRCKTAEQMKGLWKLTSAAWRAGKGRFWPRQVRTWAFLLLACMLLTNVMSC